MNVLDIVLIGIALSMDACALTIANCTTYKSSLNKKRELSMPVAFALFQGVMPLIGYFVGKIFSDFINSVAGYLTAGIFFLLAIKIIIDVLKERKKEKIESEAPEKTHGEFTLVILAVQALATSIDALAVGITLVNLPFSVFIAVAVIAGTTFILVSVALLFGKSLGKLFGKYAEWIGAVILIALAIKTLISAIL